MIYNLPPGLEMTVYPDGGRWPNYQGKHLLSVGKVLNSVYPMPEIDPFYLQRGKFVHQATELIDAGTLDWANLDDRLESYCRAYESFLGMAHPVIELSEQIVVALDYSYGGRLDRVLQLPGRERMLLTDIKVGNGKERRYQLQLAAYAVALAGECAGNYDLALLNLGKNAEPRLTVLDNPGGLIQEWRGLLANYLKGAA